MNKKLLREADKWLKEYKKNKEFYNLLCEDIEFAEKNLIAEDKLKGISYDGIRVSKTNVVSRQVEEQVVRIFENLEQKKIYRDSLEYVLHRTEKAIECLGEEERKLIKLRYLNRESLSWQQVAFRLNRSVDNVKGKLKNRSLREFVNIYWGRSYKDFLQENTRGTLLKEK
ncbi:hypothetical protein [Dethiothermospora halolimnae]|uniref:hypothetical protein n=1 Tax=Dethiothermospora halolimnae TaxID=3114390 RepID=UPI003CCC0A27